MGEQVVGEQVVGRLLKYNERDAKVRQLLGEDRCVIEYDDDESPPTDVIAVETAIENFKSSSSKKQEHQQDHQQKH